MPKGENQLYELRHEVAELAADSHAVTYAFDSVYAQVLETIDQRIHGLHVGFDQIGCRVCDRAFDKRVKA